VYAWRSDKLTTDLKGIEAMPLLKVIETFIGVKTIRKIHFERGLAPPWSLFYMKSALWNRL
jgi:hypothetical protein